MQVIDFEYLKRVPQLSATSVVVMGTHPQQHPSMTVLTVLENSRQHVHVRMRRSVSSCHLSDELPGHVRLLPAAGVVLTLTVVWDLIAAVSVGCILSSLQYTRRMAEVEIGACQITSSHALNGTLPSREESGLRQKELQLMRSFPGVPPKCIHAAQCRSCRVHARKRPSFCAVLHDTAAKCQDLGLPAGSRVQLAILPDAVRLSSAT